MEVCVWACLHNSARGGLIGIIGGLGLNYLRDHFFGDASVTVEEVSAGIYKLAMSGDTQFDKGSSNLRPDALPTLRKVASVVNSYDMNLAIAGFTDTDGSEVLNQQLSDARANAVKSALMSFGVNPERFLEVRGVGEKRPVIVNGIEDKAASRRVEVYFVQTEEGQG